jgi:signal transduction histidine kinase
MAASMSHEIRNPLVAIRTFAELLPQRYNDPEFRKEFSGLVFEEVGRLTRIIDQINDFAHPPKLAFNAVDVRRPVADAIRALSGLADGASVTVRTEFADDAPPARADEQALRQCVEHLIRNAVESVPAGRPGAIAVSTRKTTNRSGQPCVALTVQDNGQGIPAEIRDKVFSPFCTSKTQGMGLGLPIVRRTVVDHDGTMELDSNAQGTRVTLTLPAANGHHDA